MTALERRTRTLARIIPASIHDADSWRSNSAGRILIATLRSSLVSRAQNAQLRLRFEREAKTISQLSHPNICTLYDVGDISSWNYSMVRRSPIGDHEPDCAFWRSERMTNHDRTRSRVDRGETV